MSSSLIDSVGSLICSTKFSSLKLMKPHEYLLHNLTCEGKREGLGIYNTRKLFASDQEALAPCIPGRHWWGTGSSGFPEIQRRGKRFCRCLGGASPSQDGPLGCKSQVIFGKGPWGAGLSDGKGRVG